MEIIVDRLLADLGALAAVGATGDGGNCRLALTDEDAGGRELVVGWMRDLGLDVRVDRVGNVVATRAGTDPQAAPVMTGSHIDTVRTGGRYDGTLGVLAGLEVVRALDDAGRRTRRPVAVAFFTDEEGSRFAPDMLGSLVYVAARFGEPMVGTVGRLQLHPDLVNVVPATATMTVDLRHTDERMLAEAEHQLRDNVAKIAAGEGVGESWRQLARFSPVEFDAGIVDRVDRAAQQRHLTTMRLPSGAGHDAQMLARVCPTGMVFVPSRKGISHNPAEHTDPEHLWAGASVLLDVIVELAA